jgi:hypothetical protein
MALKEVKKTDENLATLKGILLNLDNGDLAAVDTAITKLGFKNRESLLRYALAVIAQTDTPVLYVNKSGEKIALVPNKDLLNETGVSQ